jgi:hypothetical protein
MSNDNDPAPVGLTGEEQATITACTRLVKLANDIAAATGAAAEHDWQVVNYSIQCSRCPLDSAGSVLRCGAVPPCVPANTCPERRQTGGRHLLLPAIGGQGSDCCYCRTTYPGTPTLVSNPVSRNAPNP